MLGKKLGLKLLSLMMVLAFLVSFVPAQSAMAEPISSYEGKDGWTLLDYSTEPHGTFLQQYEELSLTSDKITGTGPGVYVEKNGEKGTNKVIVFDTGKTATAVNTEIKSDEGYDKQKVGWIRYSNAGKIHGQDVDVILYIDHVNYKANGNEVNFVNKDNRLLIGYLDTTHTAIGLGGSASWAKDKDGKNTEDSNGTYSKDSYVVFQRSSVYNYPTMTVDFTVHVVPAGEKIDDYENIDCQLDWPFLFVASDIDFEEGNEGVTMKSGFTGDYWSYKTATTDITTDADGVTVKAAGDTTAGDKEWSEASVFGKTSTGKFTIGFIEGNCGTTLDIRSFKGYNVTYKVEGDSKYDIPKDADETPVDENYYPYNKDVKVAKTPTTSWTTSDGTENGIPGEWTFEGWNKDNKEVGESFAISEDTELVGKWVFTPTTYTVTYVATPDPEFGVPDDADTPRDRTKYITNAPVTVADDLVTDWVTSDGTETGVPGTWTFTPWDKEDFNINEDTTITGAWTFTPSGEPDRDTLKVTYVVEPDPVYGTPDLKAPIDDNPYDEGDTVVVVDDPETTWETSDGTEDGIPGEWIFKGWDKENFEITEDTTITGEWVFVPAESFTVTYKYNGDTTYGVPDAKLPNSKEYAANSRVKVAGTPTTSWTTSDGTDRGVKGTWTFVSWDTEDFIITEDTVITGEWKFTKRNTAGGGGIGNITPNNPPALNTDDHFSYIIGYPDGTVQPQGNITRAEAATIFFRLLKNDVRDENWATTNNYSDVSKDQWYNNAISTLSNMGIVKGFEDGTFRPNDGITRAEFATMAVSFFDYTNTEYNGTFSDVEQGAWFAKYVEAAYNQNLIAGFEDGTFRPNQKIKRSEACTIVNNTLGRQPEKDHLLPTSDMVTWPDCTPDAWYYAQMMEATNSHDYSRGDTEETWTNKLEQRDWVKLEKEWSEANSAPYDGEVVNAIKNLLGM